MSPAGAPGNDAPEVHILAPSLRRRMAAFVYEGILLFGVVMISGLIYAGLTQQRHALHGKAGLQAFVLVVLAVYFVWFWSHGGQTVAMKAWRIRLVSTDGHVVSQGRALGRFVLCWLWFLPALATAQLTGLETIGAYSAALLAGVVGYAAISRLRPDRQFWHDVVCKTRLVHWQPPPLRR